MRKLINPQQEELQAAVQRATSPLVMEATRMLRMNQYLLDRLEALASPYDYNRWVRFQLRWNLPPPPQGFEDKQTLEITYHANRLMLDRIGPDDKLISALWMQEHSHPLPPSMSIVNGVLHGAKYLDPTTQGGTA